MLMFMFWLVLLAGALFCVANPLFGAMLAGAAALVLWCDWAFDTPVPALLLIVCAAHWGGRALAAREAARKNPNAAPAADDK